MDEITNSVCHILLVIYLCSGGDQGHWSDLAGSDFLLLLTSVFCMLFVVKTSCQDWGQLYLLQERGLSTHSASAYLSSMEIGGIAGCIAMGALTDFMIRRRYYFGTGKSPRMIVVQLCVAGSCLFLNLFLFSIDLESSHVSCTKSYHTRIPMLYLAEQLNMFINRDN